MKKIAGMFAFVMIGLFVFSASASEADMGRIGIIDFQKVLVESDAGKAVQARIQQKGRSMESDLTEMGEEIESMMEQLQRDSMVMSSERREQQQRELEIRRYDFQTTQKKYQSEFRELEVTLMEKIRDEVFEIAEAIGKQEGYMLIIERSAAIYFPDTIDITDKVIQMYNEQFDGEL
ncbi:MAG: OmpH family outer membrane protein [Desulfosalsimonadaceae bacterium]